MTATMAPSPAPSIHPAIPVNHVVDAPQELTDREHLADCYAGYGDTHTEWDTDWLTGGSED